MTNVKVAFNVIVPAKGFLYRYFEREIRKALETDARNEIRELFYRTVDSWETKVYFRGTIRTTGDQLTLTVQPYGSGKEIYNLVSRGARPHPIEPRNAKFLRFQSGYQAATYPSWIGSRRKKRFGNWVMTQHVNHPGFEGREFEAEITRVYQPRFEQLMQRAVYRFSLIQAREFSEIQKTPSPHPVER